MIDYEGRLTKAIELYDEAEAVVISAGQGMAYEAGLELYGDRKIRDFGDFSSKYFFIDLHDGFRLPYSMENKWAFMARYADKTFYSVPPSQLHSSVLDLVARKPHFVITGTDDGLFNKSGFSDKRVFNTIGIPDTIQCFDGCHNKTYDFAQLCREMLGATRDCRIPTGMIPSCPVCSSDMTLNVNIHNEKFVRSDRFEQEFDNYYRFIRKSKRSRLLVIEIGVRPYCRGGFDLHYVFEHIMQYAPHTRMIRINKYERECFACNANKVVNFKESAVQVISDMLARRPRPRRGRKPYLLDPEK